jgi:hypothetical protein
MELANYLIDQGGKDWAQLLRPWHWLVPSTFTVWMVNRFGEPILVFDDASVHYFDIGAGKLTQIAESRDDFIQRVDLNGNANDWFMIPLVDQCAAAGLALGPDQCYAFRQLPVLGGDYVMANVMVSKLAGYYEYAGLVHERIRGYPDGTRVKIQVSK